MRWVVINKQPGLLCVCVILECTLVDPARCGCYTTK
jgi:hypothetical protein